MKKVFAIAALLLAFSPLSQAQNYPSPHRDEVRYSEPWRPGPDMRNDRPVIVVQERHTVNKPHKHQHAKPQVRCRDGSRQYNAHACRHHHGVRK